MLSAPGFVSLQAYTRRFGAPATQETTGVLAGGLSPFPFPGHRVLAFVVVPVLGTRPSDEAERFRAGAGLVYAFG